MDYFRQMAAVGGVFLLLGGLLWWMRRRGFAAPRAARAARRIEVLERLTLAPQHTLHLVRLDRTSLLVSCSPGGCRLIDTSAGSRVAVAEEVAR
jgi:flagellar biogenesis protein FliO